MADQIKILRRSRLRRIFGTSTLLKNLPFIYFIGLLAVIYIANVHYAEGNMRKMNALESELRELNWEYMTLKSDVMYNSTQSQTEKRVAALNLKMTHEIPRTIDVRKKK